MEIFDSLLNLEDDFYKEGYEEGLRDGTRAGFLEGKQFGVQKGLQRYLALGILQGRLKQWKTSAEGATGNTDKLGKQLAQLEVLLTDIPLTNSDDDVNEFELRLKRAKLKAKVIMAALKDTTPLVLQEESVNLKDTEENIENMI